MHLREALADGWRCHLCFLSSACACAVSAHGGPHTTKHMPTYMHICMHGNERQTRHEDSHGNLMVGSEEKKTITSTREGGEGDRKQGRETNNNNAGKAHRSRLSLCFGCCRSACRCLLHPSCCGDTGHRIIKGVTLLSSPLLSSLSFQWSGTRTTITCACLRTCKRKNASEATAEKKKVCDKEFFSFLLFWSLTKVFPLALLVLRISLVLSVVCVHV